VDASFPLEHDLWAVRRIQHTIRRIEKKPSFPKTGQAITRYPRVKLLSSKEEIYGKEKL
jgi:hypothetical protein